MPARWSMPLENFRKLHIGGGAEADAIEKSRDALTALGRREAEEARVIIEQLPRREVVVEIRLLGQIADLAMHDDVVD